MPYWAFLQRACSHAKHDDDDPELGFSYIFPSLELAFWRPGDDDDEEPHFATVGIGVRGYFDTYGAATGRKWRGLRLTIAIGVHTVLKNRTAYG